MNENRRSGVAEPSGRVLNIVVSGGDGEVTVDFGVRARSIGMRPAAARELARTIQEAADAADGNRDAE